MAVEITEEFVWQSIPPRARDSHKGTFGSVLAVAGSAFYRGAALLAAEGALRTGAGIVTLASVEPVVSAAVTRLPECCLCPCKEGAQGGIAPENVSLLRRQKATVLLLGPGLGGTAQSAARATETRTLVQQLLHQRAGLGGPGGALRCAAKAGAQQQHGSLLPPEQRHIFRRNAALCAFLTGAQAALRQTSHSGADHRLYACKGNDTRPGAQCTLGCQQRSAPVKGTARHRQHAAKGTLMAIPGAGRDALPDKFFGNFHSHGRTSNGMI